MGPPLSASRGKELQSEPEETSYSSDLGLEAPLSGVKLGEKCRLVGVGFLIH